MTTINPTDADIDALAASMPDGAGGMLKTWGYRQFARAVLERFAPAAAEPVGWFDTSTSSGTIRWRQGLTAESFPEGHPFYAAPVASAPVDDERKPVAKLRFGSGDGMPSILSWNSRPAGTYLVYAAPQASAEARTALPELDDRASYPASTVRRYMAAAVVTDRQQRAGDAVPMTARVDAAMVEMRHIQPPLRRSECERLIRAALAAPKQGE